MTQQSASVNAQSITSDDRPKTCLWILHCCIHGFLHLGHFIRRGLSSCFGPHA